MKDAYNFLEFEFREKLIKVIGLWDDIERFKDEKSNDDLSLFGIFYQIHSKSQIIIGKII